MRNIFLFIRRYFNLLTFLVLQFIALSFLIRYNNFHRATFLGVANELTGRINTQYDKAEDFLHLKEENLRVHRMNDSLMNLLSSNYLAPDTSKKTVRDSVKYDTLSGYRRYTWREAKVVFNATSSQKNYIQINRGSGQGIKDNMAVVDSHGAAVGVVVNVSENFSQIMSLLHVQSKVNASLKKTEEFGTVEWDGKDPRYVTLKGIPKSVDVKIGDTVLTSIYSYNFPPGLMLGTVQEVVKDNSSSFFVLKIKTATNFYNVQQVFVIENLQRDEQSRLDESTRKKIDNTSKKN
jgi:rod shape-determining protein MreC